MEPKSQLTGFPVGLILEKQKILFNSSSAKNSQVDVSIEFIKRELKFLPKFFWKAIVETATFCPIDAVFLYPKEDIERAVAFILPLSFSEQRMLQECSFFGPQLNRNFKHDYLGWLWEGPPIHTHTRTSIMTLMISMTLFRCIFTQAEMNYYQTKCFEIPTYHLE